MSVVYANPVRDLLDEALLSTDLADFIRSGDGGLGILDRLYYTDYSVSVSDRGLALSIDLVIQGELAIGLPGVSGLALVLGGSGGTTELTVALLLAPNDFELRLDNIKLALRFPPSILKPVPQGAGATAPQYAQVETQVSLVLDRNLNLRVEGAQSLALPECEIAGSGVTVSAQSITWNFERGKTLPGAVAAGLSGEFIGVALQQTTVKLPSEIANGPQLTFDYCCIGTGGFTGGVSTTFTTPVSCQVGGFTVQLTRVGLRFQESRLIVGEVEALLKGLSFFDTDVAVDLQLQTSRGLRIALSAVPSRLAAGMSVTNGLLTLEKQGIVRMTLTSAAIEVSATGGTLRLSGTLTPLVTLPGGGALPGFTVDALTITSDGKVSVDGGWVNMPEALRVALGPFAIELTRAGLGTEASGERWVGFSGTLSLVQGVPVTATLDGLKIKWDTTGFKGVELSGIGLHLEVQGVLVLDAAVRYDRVAQRFDGMGSLRLISLNLTITVRCVIGRRADYNYLYLYLLLQPPVGVPIFNTGLAFYSFEALYARHMEPDKKPSERWFHDWYRRPQLGAVETAKWADVQGSQAFGAGVILGTVPDKGYSVGVKGLLIIIVPGPVILLEARANLLKDPSELAQPQKQALFNALVVYDGRAGTLELGVEPHYVFPDAGELVDVTGIAEAFYSFNDPRAWYVYLGRREREKRIRARILSIFEANFYLMLEPTGLELGGFLGYDKTFSAGPARLTLQAYIEGYAAVSWRPKQFKGNLHLQGQVSVAVAGMSLGVSASATVAAQAPQPYEIDASVRVKVDLPFPIPDLEATARFHWETPGPPRLTAPLQAVGTEHVPTKASWSLGGAAPVIPLDGRLSLAFDRAVNDHVSVGTNAVASADSVLGDYRFRTSLMGIVLKVFDPAANDYVPFASPSGQPRALYGMWQAQSGDAAQRNRRLMLWVRTPYEWSRALSQPSIAVLEEADHFSPCEPMMETRFVDFENEANAIFEPRSSWALAALSCSTGPTYLAIDAVDRSLAGNPTSGSLPRRYYRGLFIPDQFGYVAVSSPTTSGGGGAGVPSTQQLVPLRIVFPGDLKGVSVLTLAAGRWSLEAFDAAGNSLGLVQSPMPKTPVLTFRVSQLQLWRKGIRRVDISCDYRMIVLALAFQGAPTAAEVAATRLAMEQTLERFKSEEPVLLPHRRYRLEVITTVVETRGESLQGAQVEQPPGAVVTINGPTATIVQQFEFETQGPPGDTQLAPLGTNADAVTGLDTLEPYVRQVLPPPGAPAVYRNYDIGVAFNTDYVDHMYRSNVSAAWPNGQTLKIDLRSDLGVIITVSNSTGRGNEIVLRREEKTWLRTLERSTCQLTIAQSDIVRESVVTARLSVGPLEPRRRYEAVLRGDPNGLHEAAKPLYRWSFISSAYRNFADHFHLRTTARTATVQPTATWGQWLTLLGPALAPGDPWQAPGDERRRRCEAEVAAFQALFETIDLERALPADVELHRIDAGASHWAVLLSSPEPFDWERLTLETRRRVRRRRGRPRVTYTPLTTRLLRDADGTRALIIRLAGSSPVPWSAGRYRVTGRFRRDPGGGLPRLTEQGQSSDELASISFTLP